MRAMPQTDAQLHPRSTPPQKAVGLAGGGHRIGTLALVVLTFNVWVTSVVNGALGTTSIEATLDQIQVNLGQGQFSIVGLSWQSTDGNTRVFLDSLTYAIPRWRSGTWYLASAHAGSTSSECGGIGHGETAAAPFWEELAKGLHIDSLTWRSIDGVGQPQPHRPHCRKPIARTDLGPNRHSLGTTCVLAEGTWHRRALPDTLVLAPGQCSASWSSGLDFTAMA